MAPAGINLKKLGGQKKFGWSVGILFEKSIHFERYCLFQPNAKKHGLTQELFRLGASTENSWQKKLGGEYIVRNFYGNKFFFHVF